MILGKNNFIIDAPIVMGICNVTPDSFSDGGKSFKQKDALKNINNMLKNGAQIIDIGAESTKPGSDPLSYKEEIKSFKVVKPKASSYKELLTLITKVA